MNTKYYIGFDIHKKIIAFCIKTITGEIVEQGILPARRKALQDWASHIDKEWDGFHGSNPFYGMDL